MFLRSCSFGVMVALALSTVTHADQPTLSIQQKATLVLFGVEVTVLVDCEGSTEFEINVGVRQGDLVGESLGVFFQSDGGGKQELAVFVPGVFAPGEADATAILACSTLLEGMRLGQSIMITE